MRWKPGRRSRNLEDRRAEGGARRSPFPFPFPMGRGGGGGMRRRVPMPRGRAPKLSLSTLIILAVLFFLFRGDLLQILGGQGGQITVPSQPGARVPGGGGLPPGQVGASGSPAEERLVDFVSFVLDDLQTTWSRILPGYRDAKLVVFRGSVRSGCGFAAAQMGPFYCPADEKVYIDLGFFEDLHSRFGAPGDFAQAYVIAHEIGHHIQKVTGIEPQVRRAQQARPHLKNQLSVRMELQADCLAGVWGHSTNRRDILEEGDIEEGLRAAAAIGDDRIQKQTTGTIQPEAFTHGSSAQRVEWFRRGFETGSVDACDTF